MTTYLISFETQRKRIRRRYVMAPSLKAALGLGQELNAAIGAQAIVVRPVRGR